MEDCINCLCILYNDQYRYAFLFDHSSGHAKKCIGGLNVGAMNKGFGGEHLRGTLIEKKEGYLGPYHSCSVSKKKTGVTWNLVFTGSYDNIGIVLRTGFMYESYDIGKNRKAHCIIGKKQKFRCDIETGHKMVSICRNKKSYVW